MSKSLKNFITIDVGISLSEFFSTSHAADHIGDTREIHSSAAATRIFVTVMECQDRFF